MADEYLKTISMNWPAGMRRKYTGVQSTDAQSGALGQQSSEVSTQYKEECFVDAALNGNLKLLLQFTTNMVVDCRNEKDETPLIAAAIGGQAKSVFFLLAKGANPSALDATGNSALHHASLAEHLDVIDKLLARCDPNLKNKDGESALHIVVKENKYRALEHLMKSSTINLDDQDMDGNTVAHIAIITKNLKVLTMLVAMPLDLSLYNRDGMNPLNLAVEKDEIEFLKVLLQSQGNMGIVTKRTFYGESNLEIAIRLGHRALICYFLNPSMHPGDLISCQIDKKYGYTALHWAVLQFDFNLVGKIIDINSKLLNVKDNWGKTPLEHICSIHGLENSVKENIVDMAIKLIVEGSDMNLIQNKEELFKLIKDTFLVKLAL